MEEVIEGIALKQVMDDLRPDMVVVGEPDRSQPQPRRARAGRDSTGDHRSSGSFVVAAVGGLNAVHEMIRVIDAIEHLPVQSHPMIGDAIFALCDIISDPYPGYSVIPSRLQAPPMIAVYTVKRRKVCSVPS